MSATTAKGLMAPTGTRIVGTLERLSGVARVEGFEPDGEPIYSGETEILWDEQRTVIRDDEHVYIDANGEEWLQSQLVEAQPAETVQEWAARQRAENAAMCRAEAQ